MKRLKYKKKAKANRNLETFALPNMHYNQQQLLYITRITN